MNKLRLIMAILLLTPYYLHSQEVIKYTFKVSKEKVCQGSQNGFVYFTIMDSIVGKGMVKENGLCSIFQRNDINNENINVTIRQNDSCIVMVGLQRLIDYNCAVEFSKMSIELIGMDSLMDVGNISKYEGKPFLQSYMEEGVTAKLGAESWYFPTETLKFPTEYYFNRIIKDTLLLEDFRYCRGRYPNQHELDSIISITSRQTAENDAGWCSKNLLELCEPNFSNGYEKNAFRFTWISNYKHYLYDPYTIRIETDKKNNPIMYFSYKMFDFCDRNSIVCKIIPMTNSEYQKFLYLVDEYQYWTIPSRVDQGEGDSEFAFSILEGIYNDRYHVVYRDSKRDKGMMKIREFLWSLTGLGENKIVHKRQRIE